MHVCMCWCIATCLWHVYRDTVCVHVSMHVYGLRVLFLLLLQWSWSIRAGSTLSDLICDSTCHVCWWHLSSRNNDTCIEYSSLLIYLVYSIYPDQTSWCITIYKQKDSEVRDALNVHLALYIEVDGAAFCLYIFVPCIICCVIMINRSDKLCKKTLMVYI